MSAIAGIYNLDGQPVNRDDIVCMVDLLSHRGPDGAELWCEGVVGFGHLMLHTTPESLHEVLPLIDKTRDLAMTCDARIDNRGELMEALGLVTAIQGELSDSQLILLAYVKWGNDCPNHLLGDFIFAIWDARKQKLFCARDHFGIKPFYYYHAPGQFFAFASEIKALWCLKEVPQCLNEIRMTDYLSFQLDDTQATFYKDVLRLPPAHFLSVDETLCSVQRYWELDPKRELILASDEEYAARFREIFTEAVRCRLRSAFSVGSMLSGGLDSSSVACVAQNILDSECKGLLPTYSGLYKNVPDCDESNFIDAVIAQGGFKPYFDASDQRGPLHNLSRILWHEDEPFRAPGLYNSWEIYKDAERTGTRILLDGHGGDEVVSDGEEYVKQLLAHKQWSKLYHELRALENNDFLGGRSARRLWVSNIFKHTWPVNLLIRLANRLSHPVKLLLARTSRAEKEIRSTADWEDFINKSLLSGNEQQQTKCEQAKKTVSYVPDSKTGHYSDLASGLVPLALEILDKAAAAAAVEARYPFYDKRLIEFCLSVPADQKLKDGWTRSLLRRAMTGILPKEVQWRNHKTYFEANLVYGLVNFDGDVLPGLADYEVQSPANYLDVDKICKLYTAIVEKEHEPLSEDVYLLLCLVTLYYWLLAPFKKCSDFALIETVSHNFPSPNVKS